jgi:hypothetical protein
MSIPVPTKYLCKPIYNMDVTGEIPTKPTLQGKMVTGRITLSYILCIFD